MAFVSKSEPGGAAGYVWEVGGPEGAIEVDDVTAFKIVRDLPHVFSFVQAPAKAATAEKKAAKAKEDVEEVPAIEPELAEAVEAASPTKKRATKE